MANILIVEDERPINDLLKKNLILVGHQCVQCFDGMEALKTVEEGRCAFDLAILDVMLPGMDGFELFERIKPLPTIFLTAKTLLADKLKGLGLGADDYVSKPFEMLELLARVNTVLNRTKRNDKTVSFDGILVDFERKQVFREGKEVFLTPKEFTLLEVLIKNRNLTLSRDKLISLVWEFDYEGDTRTVDVHILQLRKKLGIKERIRTVFKSGYRFEL